MKYKGLIFTKHALLRMQERNLSFGDVWATWNRPDSSRYAVSQNAYVFYRTWPVCKIEVVASKNDRGEWVIISVWSKTNDYQANSNKNKNNEKFSFWKILKSIFSLR